MSKKANFKWIFVEKKVFDEITQIFTGDTLLIYPDLNKHFYIHTNSIELQLG